MKGPLFYAKILLFGEYGIIKDSKGLAIPYNTYQGALKKGVNLDEQELKSNKNLRQFYNYLFQLDALDITQFDLEGFNNDLKEGLFFDSSIPQGYGVGSSGALVAAIYDKYAKNKITVLENLTHQF